MNVQIALEHSDIEVRGRKIGHVSGSDSIFQDNIFKLPPLL